MHYKMRGKKMNGDWVITTTNFDWRDEATMLRIVEILDPLKVAFDYQCIARLRFETDAEMRDFLSTQEPSWQIQSNQANLTVRLEPCQNFAALESWCVASPSVVRVGAIGDAMLSFEDEETARRFERECENQKHLFRGELPVLYRLP
jgi:hypothetical protein